MTGLITALALSKPLRWALAGLLAFGGYEAWKYHQRSIGEKSAIQKIEKANDKAIGIGNAGAGKSGIRGMPGKRDPHTRDNEAD